ncbi:MAG: hypothetical protein AABX51_08295 [Nanoarchaeota archaeon]
MQPLVAFFVELITRWVSLIGGPFNDPIMLWILIPTYMSWFITEFFQEKRGTSWGNVVSNSVVPIFVGWDWMRTVYTRLSEGSLQLDWQAGTKAGIAAFVFFYGVQIFISGVKLKKRAQFIGRMRVVTYVILMLTPVYYGTVPFDFLSFISMIIFFPLFYVVFELIDRIVPDSNLMHEDELEAESKKTVKNPLPIQQKPLQPRPQPQLLPQRYAHPFPAQHYNQFYQVRR